MSLPLEGTMTAPDFSHLRQRMMAEIAVKTIYRSAQLGKAALHRRVMDESMGSNQCKSMANQWGQVLQ